MVASMTGYGRGEANGEGKSIQLKSNQLITDI